MSLERIEELCLKQPLREKSEYYTEWYNINDYKKYVVCFCGNVMLNVSIQFSCDTTKDKEPMVTVICASASGLYKWACDKVKLQFVRICIKNNTGQFNDKIDFNFFGCDRVTNQTKVTFSEPLPNLRATIAEGTESPRGLSFLPDSPTKSRFKSPFKKDRPKSNLSEAPKPKGPPIRDNRIPDSLPECLLVGQKGGSYKHLKGMPDQYLKMGRDGLEFAFMFPPPSEPDEWKLKE